MKFVGVIMAAIVVTLFAGWIVNIVKFAQLDFQKPVKAEIIRGIGIVAQPVGGIIGFVKIKDK